MERFARRLNPKAIKFLLSLVDMEDLNRFKPRPTFLISAPRCELSCHHGLRDSGGCSYQVSWVINPHMKPGTVSAGETRRQHKQFVTSLSEAGSRVFEIPFVHGAYDSVFAKDNALLARTERGEMIALLSNFVKDERAIEQNARQQILEQFGFTIVGRAQSKLEGGDVIFVTTNAYQKVYFGYGIRSHRGAFREIDHFFEREVCALELRDPHFYHLDTALAFAHRGDDVIAFACPDAFTKSSWNRLLCDPDIAEVISVEREEALKFGLNWIEIGDTVIIGSLVPGITAALADAGKTVIVSPLSEFQNAGGSAACLALQIHDLGEQATLWSPSYRKKLQKEDRFLDASFAI